MLRRSTLKLLPVLLATGLFAPLLSPVASAQESAQTSVETVVGGVLEVLYGANRPTNLLEREKKVRAVLDTRFSFDAFVLRALGQNRGKLTSAELSKVSTLTVDLMVRTYVQQFDGSARPAISFGKITDLGNNRAELKSTVNLAGKRYAVIYRIAKLESGWQVYDLVIEGASLVSNYRKQFDAHFRRGTASQLIAKLEKQLKR